MNHRSTASALVKAIDSMPNTDQPWHDKEDRKLIQQARENMHLILDKFGYELAPGGKRPIAKKFTAEEKKVALARRQKLTELWAINLNDTQETIYRIAKLALNSRGSKVYNDLDAALQFAIDAMRQMGAPEVDRQPIYHTLLLVQEINADEAAVIELHLDAKYGKAGA